jgi:hypothetical protein
MDVFGGQVHLLFATGASVNGFIAAGKTRCSYSSTSLGHSATCARLNGAAGSAARWEPHLPGIVKTA